MLHAPLTHGSLCAIDQIVCYQGKALGPDQQMVDSNSLGEHSIVDALQAVGLAAKVLAFQRSIVGQTMPGFQKETRIDSGAGLRILIQTHYRTVVGHQSQTGCQNSSAQQSLDYLRLAVVR